MKNIKTFEEVDYVDYELEDGNIKNGEDALDGWKRQRDDEIDVHLGQLGDVVDLLQQAKDMLMDIDSKGYNQESVDGIQKVISKLEI